jgi:hypothetical protein
MSICIDTEIWTFAQKVPDPSKFTDKSEYNKALRIHKKASGFLNQKISESDICMTNHQLCEIFHSLAFRGMKLPHEYVSKYCNQLLSSKFMHWYQVSENHVKQAINYSIKSGIHIWDYLCVLPLYNDVKVIFSCDDHFRHDTFRSLGPKIENPIGEWITL